MLNRFFYSTFCVSFIFSCSVSAGFMDSLTPFASEAQKVVSAYSMNEEEEIEIGQTYYEQYIKESGGLYSNSEAQRAIKDFAAPLFKNAQRKDLPWEIVILNNDEVNAWALPGGKVAVNSGLIKQSGSKEELASVIAHEIGHVDLGHGVKQLKAKNYLSVASNTGKIALSKFGGEYGSLGAQALSVIEEPLFSIVTSGYSREHEFEADQHIFYIFEKNSLDPKKADDFFIKLDKLYPSQTSVTTSLFSTHPGTKDRIEAIQKEAKTKNYKVSTKEDIAYETLKKLVK